MRRGAIVSRETRARRCRKAPPAAGRQTSRRATGYDIAKARSRRSFPSRPDWPASSADTIWSAGARIPARVPGRFRHRPAPPAISKASNTCTDVSPKPAGRHSGPRGRTLVISPWRSAARSCRPCSHANYSIGHRLVGSPPGIPTTGLLVNFAIPLRASPITSTNPAAQILYNDLPHTLLLARRPHLQ